MGRTLLLVAIGVVVLVAAYRLLRGNRQVALTKRALREVGKGRFRVEPYDLREVPPACVEVADELVAAGFAVMGAIVTRLHRLPDSFTILLLDADAKTYARATALERGAGTWGTTSYLLDGRRLDTTMSNLAIADPQVIAQLLPGATVAEVVAAHRKRLLEQQARNNPAQPIDPERLPDLVRQGWVDDARGIEAHGVTRTSDDPDPTGTLPTWGP